MVVAVFWLVLCPKGDTCEAGTDSDVLVGACSDGISICNRKVQVSFKLGLCIDELMSFLFGSVLLSFVAVATLLIFDLTEATADLLSHRQCRVSLFSVFFFTFGSMLSSTIVS